MSLKYAILGFLSFTPLSGYDLKKAFDNSVRHFWPANQSQIYRTLAELDSEGLVEKEIVPRPDRLDLKIYSITAAGKAELHRWLAAPLPEADQREAFLIQVYFGGQLGDPELLDLLAKKQAELEGNLHTYLEIYQAYRSQPPDFPDRRAFLLSMLTLEYGLISNQAAIRWLENARARLQAGDYSLIDPASLLG